MLVQQESPSPRKRKTGPIAAWLFILSYWALTSFFGRVASTSQIPQVLTTSLLLSFIVSQLVEYVPILVFVFLLVWLSEKRERNGGIRSLFSSVGWRRTGIKQSLKWSIVFLLLLAPIALLLSEIQSVLVGSASQLGSAASKAVPTYYFLFVIISALCTAITEETALRGYILDRLMPAHPSTLRQSLNAVLITSILMMSYHAVPYLNSYGFSLSITILSLASVFVYSIFISFAYVRSRVKNVSGPILFHFILDAGVYIILLASLLL